MEQPGVVSPETWPPVGRPTSEIRIGVVEQVHTLDITSASDSWRRPCRESGCGESTGEGSIPDHEAEAERVAGRIGIDLEVVTFGGAPGGCKHSRTERHHVLVGGGEVLDPQVEMHLLWRRTVRPVRRNVVGCVLNANARLAVDNDHVPPITPIDLATQHSGPECTLFIEIGRVEHDNLKPNPHPTSVLLDGGLTNDGESGALS